MLVIAWFINVKRDVVSIQEIPMRFASKVLLYPMKRDLF